MIGGRILRNVSRLGESCWSSPSSFRTPWSLSLRSSTQGLPFSRLSRPKIEPAPPQPVVPPSIADINLITKRFFSSSGHGHDGSSDDSSFFSSKLFSAFGVLFGLCSGATAYHLLVNRDGNFGRNCIVSCANNNYGCPPPSSYCSPQPPRNSSTQAPTYYCPPAPTFSSEPPPPVCPTPQPQYCCPPNFGPDPVPCCVCPDEEEEECVEDPKSEEKKSCKKPKCKPPKCVQKTCYSSRVRDPTTECLEQKICQANHDLELALMDTKIKAIDYTEDAVKAYCEAMVLMKKYLFWGYRAIQLDERSCHYAEYWCAAYKASKKRCAKVTEALKKGQAAWKLLCRLKDVIKCGQECQFTSNNRLLLPVEEAYYRAETELLRVKKEMEAICGTNKAVACYKEEIKEFRESTLKPEVYASLDEEACGRIQYVEQETAMMIDHAYKRLLRMQARLAKETACATWRSCPDETPIAPECEAYAEQCRQEQQCLQEQQCRQEQQQCPQQQENEYEYEYDYDYDEDSCEPPQSPQPKPQYSWSLCTPYPQPYVKYVEQQSSCPEEPPTDECPVYQEMPMCSVMSPLPEPQTEEECCEEIPEEEEWCEEKPKDKCCDEKPKDPCSDEKPKDPCGEEKPKDKCSEKPKDPCCEEKPKDKCCEEKPKDPCSEEKPKDPCCEEKPKDPCSEEKPKDPCCEEKPKDPCCEEKPKDKCCEKPRSREECLEGCPVYKEMPMCSVMCPQPEPQPKEKCCEEKPKDPCCEKPKDPCCEKPKDPCGEKPKDPCCEKPKDPCCEKPKDPCGEKPNDPCCEKPKDPCGEKPKDPCCEKPKDPCCEKPKDPCCEKPKEECPEVKCPEVEPVCPPPPPTCQPQPCEPVCEPEYEVEYEYVVYEYCEDDDDDDEEEEEEEEEDDDDDECEQEDDEECEVEEYCEVQWCSP